MIIPHCRPIYASLPNTSPNSCSARPLSSNILPSHHPVLWQTRNSWRKNQLVRLPPRCCRSTWSLVFGTYCPQLQQWKVPTWVVWDPCWWNFTWTEMSTVIAIISRRYDTCLELVHMQPHPDTLRPQIRLIILICNHKKHVESAQDLIFHLSSNHFLDITSAVAELGRMPPGNLPILRSRELSRPQQLHAKVRSHNFVFLFPRAAKNPVPRPTCYWWQCRSIPHPAQSLR